MDVSGEVGWDGGEEGWGGEKEVKLEWWEGPGSEGPALTVIIKG